MTTDLKAYQFPQCLKDMDVEQMELLSVAIRDFLIEKVDVMFTGVCAKCKN